MIGAIGFMFYYAVWEEEDFMLLALYFIGITCFILVSILHCSCGTMFKSLIHFIILTPTYVNVFIIFSMCNIHDVTWGSRIDDLTEREKAL